VPGPDGALVGAVKGFSVGKDSTGSWFAGCGGGDGGSSSSSSSSSSSDDDGDDDCDDDGSGDN
jgi:hypothetical protein